MKLCGLDEDGTVPLDKLIIYGTYTIMLTSLFSYLGYKVFNSLQMFPIKEKSGKLIMLFVLTSFLFLVYYPLLIIINFQSQSTFFEDFVIGGLHFCYYSYVVIYFMRSLRIGYAYNVDKNMYGSFYHLIKNENTCCLLSVLIGVMLYFLPDLILESKENIFEFKPSLSDQFQKMTLVQFDQVILLLSLYHVRKAKSTFKIQPEISMAIFLEICFTTLKQTMRLLGGIQLCIDHFPVYYAIDCLKTYFLVVLSVVIPLFQVTKVPVHFPFTIIAENFQLFLSEPICIKLFYQYLTRYDDEIYLNYQASAHKYTQKYTRSLILVPLTLGKLKVERATVEVDSQESKFKLINESRTKSQFECSPFQDNDCLGLEVIKNIPILQEEKYSSIDKRLQTVECFMLWADLTLIFAKHDAINPNYQAEDLQLLESDISAYMKNLINVIDLTRFMPVNLAQHVQMYFGQSGQTIDTTNQIRQRLDSNWSRSASCNSIHMLLPRYESKIDDGQLDSIIELSQEIRNLMYEIISKIFHTAYKTTSSYKSLTKQFQTNEIIQDRLYKMNLTTEFK